MLTVARMLRLTELEGDAPTEFLIFRRGVNETTKGPVLFDATAAASVMAEYEKRGVDLMIDLGHASIHSTAQAGLVRADAGDARGWFKLEIRSGDLYAVDVRWTPDGARRLAERTQRYISPAVYTDKNDRAVALVNVALVSMPATIGAHALIAASWSESKMNPDQIKSALEIIAGEDAAGALELLKAIVVSAAGGGEPEAAPEAAPEPLAEVPEPKPEDPTVAAALMRLTATTSASEAIVEVTRRLARDDVRESENAAAELSARRDLVTELVKCGVEFPSTAWAGDAADRNPVKRLAEEPIAELRARVALHRKTPRAAVAPPATRATDGAIETPLGPVTLSARERSMCAELKLNVNDYAAQKAAAKKA